MNRKTYLAAGAAAALALSLAAAGGYWARASADTGAVNAAPTPPAAGAPASFAGLVQRVAPAVVSIDVERKADKQAAAWGRSFGPFSFQFGQPGQGGQGGDQGQPFGFDFPRMFQPPQDQGPLPPQRAAGSGFFISPDGYIVTNNHVVEDAQKITVHTKDERELKARVIGRDAATDLAVIKVEGDGHPYVSFEDRAKPRVGDWVVAVGNPFGLGGTATAGIVSALGRRNVGDSNYVDYMQIDAPINRGNSGGPTFDVEGRVVGVNTAIYSPSGGSVGIGFDIPADVVARVSKTLIAHGKVVRGYIGAAIQDVTPDIADSLGLHGGKGALVSEVTAGGPSDEAGLKPGDVVVELDGHAVGSAADLTRQVAAVSPGQAIRLQVLRDGHAKDISIRSGVRPSEQELAENDAGSGPGAGGPADLPEELGMRLKANGQGGLTIERVGGDSDAGTKGLRRGDVILQAGARKTATAEDLSAAVQDARKSGRKSVLLLVAHNGARIFVPVKIGNETGKG